MDQLVLEIAQPYNLKDELLQNTCLFHVCIGYLHHSEMQIVPHQIKCHSLAYITTSGKMQ
jgi:hypothetical protein